MPGCKSEASGAAVEESRPVTFEENVRLGAEKMRATPVEGRPALLEEMRRDLVKAFAEAFASVCRRLVVVGRRRFAWRCEKCSWQSEPFVFDGRRHDQASGSFGRHRKTHAPKKPPEAIP